MVDEYGFLFSFATNTKSKLFRILRGAGPGPCGRVGPVRVGVHMGPYGPIYVPIWALIWAHVWVHMGPYGTIWALVGPYGSSWTGLGDSVNFP